MGVYEVGMVGNTIEKVVCEHLCEKFGFCENARRFITSGGTLGTLTAILAAKAHYMYHVSIKSSVENKNYVLLLQNNLSIA